eukprot:TRINITY_DN1323_c0_g1_i1.p1 TRINITY_DN1323_c0_g1~~TRINITY_DN1323_c0_g1_i1.p1  ORF type:complete len:1188 (+),score=274.51 TRINITY_DN1323_c0_g1_i1:282-3566(+)
MSSQIFQQMAARVAPEIVVDGASAGAPNQDPARSAHDAPASASVPLLRLEIPHGKFAVLDTLEDLVLRDFVFYWYSAVSSNLEFPEEVRKNLHTVVEALAYRAKHLDVVTLLLSDFVQITRDHLAAVREAERQAQKKWDSAPSALSRTAREDDLLQILSASNRVHVAVEIDETEYLRRFTEVLLPLLVEPSHMQSDGVRKILREVFALKILVPLMAFLEPDYLNSWIELIPSATASGEKQGSQNATASQHASMASTPSAAAPNPAEEEAEVRPEKKRRLSFTLADTFKDEHQLSYFLDFLEPSKVMCVQFWLCCCRFSDAAQKAQAQGDPTEEFWDDARDLFNKYLSASAAQPIVAIVSEPVRRSISAQLGAPTPDQNLALLFADAEHEVFVEMDKWHNQFLSSDVAHALQAARKGLALKSPPLKTAQIPESAESAVSSPSSLPRRSSASSLLANLGSPQKAPPLATPPPSAFSQPSSPAQPRRKVSASESLPVPAAVSAPANAAGSGAVSAGAAAAAAVRLETRRDSLGRQRVGHGEIFDTPQATIINAEVVTHPKTHVVYQLKVQKGDQEWCVFRRYSQFDILHRQIKEAFPGCHVMLPPKRAFNNFDRMFVEARWDALETYLSSLLAVHSIAVSDVMADFLSVDATPLSAAPGLVEELLHGDVAKKVRQSIDTVRTGIDTVKTGLGQIGADIARVVQIGGTESTPHSPQHSPRAGGRFGSLGQGLHDMIEWARGGENLHFNVVSRAAQPKQQQPTKKSLDEDDDDDYLVSSHMEDPLLTEPLYELVDELLHLKQHGWIRRQVIRGAKEFLRISFGGTVNRYVIELVTKASDEETVIVLLSRLRDSLWPNGQLYTPAPPRTKFQELETKNTARNRLLRAIPQSMMHVFGREHCLRAGERVFEMIQYPRLLKHFGFLVLDCLFSALFPEMAPKLLTIYESMRREHRQLQLLRAAAATVAASASAENAVPAAAAAEPKPVAQPAQPPTKLSRDDSFVLVSPRAELGSPPPAAPPPPPVLHFATPKRTGFHFGFGQRRAEGDSSGQHGEAQARRDSEGKAEPEAESHGQRATRKRSISSPVSLIQALQPHAHQPK